MMIAMLNSQKYSCLSFTVFTESVKLVKKMMEKSSYESNKTLCDFIRNTDKHL